MFSNCSFGLKSLSNAYLFNNYAIKNNTYHSFFIRMFVISELLIFLTLFIVFMYFNNSLPYFLNNLFFINSFSFDFNYSFTNSLLVLVTLSSILFSLKQLFFIMKCLLTYYKCSLIFKDLLGTSLILSFIFVLIQYYELLSQVVGFFDTILFGSIYSLLLLHCFHVILGGFFLFYLFLMLTPLVFYYNAFLFYIIQLCFWYWHLIDFVWLFIILFIYVN